MKKDRMNLILVLVFIIGLSVMLYPIVSDYWNSRTQSRAVASYNETVESMDYEERDRMLEEAEAYNAKLLGVEMPFVNYDQIDGYEELLDVSGTGIMGYVTIPKIDVELPVYHGTDDAVLQVAAGHLKGSSLPTGGAGTHCVLSAHRGLPSASLFTDLDEMEEGDTFTVTVLGRSMTYRVDQIRIVEPREVEELSIDPARDYVTLMTCTPYGINSHRLLVRGVRTADADAGDYVAADAHQVNTILVAIALAILLLLLTLAAMLIRRLLFGRPAGGGLTDED